MTDNRLIFEKSVPGRRAHALMPSTLSACGDVPAHLLRQSPIGLPSLSEPDIVRHYVNLSQKNHGVDAGFYPLGSCTMKYNPKINEDVCVLPGFAAAHPLAGDAASQGSLRLMHELSGMLCEIAGMDAFSLQPAAGAHGELTGLMLIKAYHERRGDTRRTKMLVPDTSHGTNPASAAMVGYSLVEVASDAEGNVDLEDLRAKLDDEVAGLMLTNPSTLGLFERNIVDIAALVHETGGLLYYDGANLNAIMGEARPGDMGFDVVHFNLHKTFSTPHGGGGPGAGPVGVKALLADYLPVPLVEKNGDAYALCDALPYSIGKVRSFYGNFGVLVRTYAYILTMGAAGLREASRNAVLNANYLMARMKDFMAIAYDRPCMHEFVATATPQKERGSSALDIAKRMIDYGVHPPTVYFPLIVKEAMMFEPTETENKQTLDAFVDIMRDIFAQADAHPERLHEAPFNAPVGRLDDVKAARKPVLVYSEE